ncbi:MAG: hypothetical protein MUQ10_03080, partial [Anaerolineae bacterium]|nr:hypothetical protein [Anaerolineae bacterium]
MGSAPKPEIAASPRAADGAPLLAMTNRVMPIFVLHGARLRTRVPRRTCPNADMVSIPRIESEPKPEI